MIRFTRARALLALSLSCLVTVSAQAVQPTTNLVLPARTLSLAGAESVLAAVRAKALALATTGSVAVSGAASAAQDEELALTGADALQQKD